MTPAASADLPERGRPDAREEADALLAQSQSEIDNMGPVNEALAIVLARAKHAQRTNSGRELTVFESDTSKIGVLVTHLVRGSYQDQAARAADISHPPASGIGSGPPLMAMSGISQSPN